MNVLAKPYSAVEAAANRTSYHNVAGTVRVTRRIFSNLEEEARETLLSQLLIGDNTLSDVYYEVEYGEGETLYVFVSGDASYLLQQHGYPYLEEEPANLH